MFSGTSIFYGKSMIKGFYWKGLSTFFIFFIGSTKNVFSFDFDCDESFFPKFSLFWRGLLNPSSFPLPESCFLNEPSNAFSDLEAEQAFSDRELWDLNSADFYVLWESRTELSFSMFIVNCCKLAFEKKKVKKLITIEDWLIQLWQKYF